MGIIMTGKPLRPREESDHYPTPKELIKASLDKMPLSYEPEWVLDPGAGAGIYGECIVEKWPHAKVVGIEIDDSFPKHPAYYDWIRMDFRHFQMQSHYKPGMFDYSIGNPPYGQVNGIKDRKLAEKIIQIAWHYIRPEGRIDYLLRLGFLAGQHRVRDFYPKYPLKDVYALSRRPSFTGNQKTDAHEYAIFSWEKGYKGYTRMNWLEWDYDKVQGHTD